MHPNEELLRRGYRAFAEGDLETISEMFADDISWTNPGRNQFSGTLIGKDAVFEFFGRLIEATQGSFKTEIVDVCAGDDRVFCLTRTSATVEGESSEDEQCVVYDVRDGQVCGAKFFQFDPYRADEIFSRAGELAIEQTEASRVEA